MFNNKFKKGILVFSLLLLVFFVLPVNFSYADDWTGINDEAKDATSAAADNYTKTPDPTSQGDAIAGFLAWVTLGIASLFGKLLTIATGLVNGLFKVNDFEVEGVKTGWVIVRDVCNMSFILALLLIAFATILRLENYSMKKYLPKLLIMAVLINFSKSICLFLIDISQIVMLTFGNAFAGANSNFVQILQVDKLLSISRDAKFGAMPWEFFYAAGLALIFMLIAFFVMIMMMGVLIMRIVYFWILIILSPIAFLSTAVPGMGKYWGQWWGEFTKYLMVGPVLAFFTWLSLTVAKNITLFNSLNVDNKGNVTGYANFITDIGKEGAIMPFIVAIGLLLGAIKISKDIGEAGMGFGMNMMNKAKNGTVGFGKGATNRFTSKVGEVSGVSGAREYLKQRKAYREDLRTSRVQDTAGKIATNIGAFKENTVGWAGKKINTGWRNAIGGKRADDLREQAGRDKQTLNEINNGAGVGYNKLKEEITGLSKLSAGHRAKVGDSTYLKEAENLWKKIDKDGVVTTITKDISKAEDELISGRVLELKKGIEEKNKNADKLMTRQKWVDRAARAGLMAGGGALALGTGGLLSGVGVGMTGAAYSWGDIKGSGSVDKKLASSYRMNKINKEREGKKNDSDEKLFTTADDRTINAFERAAAAMELMSRKKLSAEQVHEYREELQKDLGGTEIKDGANYWKDKKLNSQFELLAGNIQGASLMHLKAQDGDERAKFEIEQGYAGGHVSMKDMSVDMINSTIGEFAKGFKDDKFKKDFHDLSESMQNAFIKALEKNGTYEAKAKLAWVTDIKKAFGEGTAKTNAEIGKFVKSLSEEDINNILAKGTDQQFKALVEVVNKSPEALSENIMRNQGSRAKSNRQTLEITT